MTTNEQAQAAARAWRYEIKYGPDGEANYAWVYDDKNQMVCTAELHHAIAIVKQFASRATPADPALDPATVERCAQIAEAIDSGRGNEKEIAKAIRALASGEERK